MELLHNLYLGFSVTLLPVNLLFCFIGVFLGTLVGVLPGLGPAATIALSAPHYVQPAAGISNHHDRGDLLWGAVRGLHDVNPRQHPRRSFLCSDLPRWISDGPSGSGRSRPRNLCVRLLYRRHVERYRLNAPGTGPCRLCPSVRSSRIFRAHVSRHRHPDVPLQGIDGEMLCFRGARALHRNNRYRHDLRGSALHLRHPDPYGWRRVGPCCNGIIRRDRGVCQPGASGDPGCLQEQDQRFAADTKGLGRIARPHYERFGDGLLPGDSPGRRCYHGIFCFLRNGETHIPPPASLSGMEQSQGLPVRKPPTMPLRVGL